MGSSLAPLFGGPVAFRGRRETRSAEGYTAIHLDAAWRRATGVERRATAAVAGAVLRWATACARFAIEPDDGRALGGLTPPVLYQIGASLGTRGESVNAIVVEDGRVRLQPCADWDVLGGADESGWRYRLSLAGPSSTTSRTVPAASVLHCRWNPDPRQPWRGRAPLATAGDTLRALGNLETSIGDEAAMHVARLLSPPAQRAYPDGTSYWPDAAGGDGDSLSHWRDSFNKLLAGTPPANVVVLPEASESVRLGAEFSDETTAVRESVERSVFRCFGIPALLFDERAPGAAYREAYRDFRVSTLSALAAVVEAELRAKLDATAVVDAAPLKASDIAAQARAVHILKDSGMSLDDAREVVGL